MKRFAILIAAFSFSGVVFSQTWTRDELRKMDDADIDFEIGDFRSALEVYSILIDKYPDNLDLNYKTGVCYFHMRNPNKESFIPIQSVSRLAQKFETLLPFTRREGA